MAADLSLTPDTGVRVQLCGDAHLSNFGMFRPPTPPGLQRQRLRRDASWTLGMGSETAHDERGHRGTRHRSHRIGRPNSGAGDGTRIPDTDGSVCNNAPPRRLVPHRRREHAPRHRAAERAARRTAKQAHGRDHLQAQAKLTEVIDGRHRIRNAPPLLVRVDKDSAVRSEVDTVLDYYMSSLPEERRYLVGKYRLIDVAMKVVGIGSVGTHSMVGLLHCEGAEEGTDPIFLQVEEAGASVLETHLGPSEYPHHGQRVVVGQRLMQAFPDIFLGWTGAPESGRQFYVRQLHDMKGSATSRDSTPLSSPRTERPAAGRSHARTPVPATRPSSPAISEQATRSTGRSSSSPSDTADQNLADFEAFAGTARDGRISAAVDA